MIVDGKQIAKEILARTRTRVTTLPHPPRVLVLFANETPAILSYMKVKLRAAEQAGCVFETKRITKDIRPYDITDMSLGADATIIQLPLAAGMDTQVLLDSIPLGKDVDVLSSVSRSIFQNKDLRNPYFLLPPVVAAVKEIFARNGVDSKGKKAVVIGEGFLVGKPVATWLAQQGADVTTLNVESKNFSEILRTADIIISGAGVSHLIKLDMIQQGLALIDAGTSESGGAIVGDADPACAPKCSLFTPVPGGVGPIAVACLFENVVTLAEKQ